MKYSFLLLAICLSIKLYAQPAISSERRVNIDGVGKYTGAIISAKIAGIRTITVGNDTLIGYAPVQYGNETCKLMVECSYDKWLETFVENRFGGTYASQGKQLLWAIKHISITSDLSAQYFFTRLQATVYVNGDGTAYRQLFTTDTVFTGIMNSDSNYVAGLVNAMDGLYQQSVARLAKAERLTINAARQKVFTVSDVINTASAEVVLPVMKDANVNEGIFTSYDAFTVNKPESSMGVWAVPDTTKGAGYVKVYTMGADSSVQQVTKIWGICLGDNELYKYEDGKLISIERDGEGIILSRYQEPKKRKNQAFYWRRLAANGWPNDTNPFCREQSVFVKHGQGDQRPVATRIDMATGELSF
ncbi:hypothetical protein [Chitinophaga sp. LS1]|uniref:hypothetical protein n=1 Tax=Chitinophaga sp. LS1 TaxID=3051176 RepID=UPI002AAC07F1|nr:hypothetical protein [Chitinophaga sp. LS1]WPV66933.1 hypothetical protein QQL36_34640 [Chitinophaga sp. LS1]